MTKSGTGGLLGGLSLRMRALVLIGGVFLAYQAGAIALSVHGDTNEAHDALSSRARMIASLQARAAGIPLNDLDLEQVKQVAKAPSGDPDYRAGIIRDDKGKVVAEDGDVRPGKGYIEVTAPILAGQKPLGEYVLRLRTDRVEARIAEDAWLAVLGGTAAFLAIMGVLYLVVSTITRPLTQITGIVGKRRRATTASPSRRSSAATRSAPWRAPSTCCARTPSTASAWRPRSWPARPRR